MPKTSILTKSLFTWNSYFVWIIGIEKKFFKKYFSFYV